MRSEAARALDLTDRKSLLALQGRGLESEAEGVRFHEHGVTALRVMAAYGNHFSHPNSARELVIRGGFDHNLPYSQHHGLKHSQFDGRPAPDWMADIRATMASLPHFSIEGTRFDSVSNRQGGSCLPDPRVPPPTLRRLDSSAERIERDLQLTGILICRFRPF
jgi:hypothetical protein